MAFGSAWPSESAAPNPFVRRGETDPRPPVPGSRVVLGQVCAALRALRVGDRHLEITIRTVVAVARRIAHSGRSRRVGIGVGDGRGTAARSGGAIEPRGGRGRAESATPLRVRSSSVGLAGGRRSTETTPFRPVAARGGSHTVSTVNSESSSRTTRTRRCQASAKAARCWSVADPSRIRRRFPIPGPPSGTSPTW